MKFVAMVFAIRNFVLRLLSQNISSRLWSSKHSRNTKETRRYHGNYRLKATHRPRHPSKKKNNQPSKNHPSKWQSAQHQARPQRTWNHRPRLHPNLIASQKTSSNPQTVNRTWNTKPLLKVPINLTCPNWMISSKRAQKVRGKRYQSLRMRSR